jgi:hypothetical protein
MDGCWRVGGWVLEGGWVGGCGRTLCWSMLLAAGARRFDVCACLRRVAPMWGHLWPSLCRQYQTELQKDKPHEQGNGTRSGAAESQEHGDKAGEDAATEGLSQKAESHEVLEPELQEHGDKAQEDFDTEGLSHKAESKGVPELINTT